MTLTPEREQEIRECRPIDHPWASGAIDSLLAEIDRLRTLRNELADTWDEAINICSRWLLDYLEGRA